MAASEVAELLRAFESSGFARLAMEIGPVRVAASRPLASDTAKEAHPDAVAVNAPVLGMFEPARASDGAPLARRGADVLTGTPIGVIRVLDALHSVTAGIAGTVVAVHAGDGAFVEFGAPLISVVPADAGVRGAP